MIEIKQKRVKFVDIDLSFARHPITDDISRRVDVNAIATSIKNLVLTKKYDRPFHPEISCQVVDLLFENFTNETASVIKRTIKYVIDNFEPRIELDFLDVRDDIDRNALEVTIAFRIVGTIETIQTQFYLERTL